MLVLDAYNGYRVQLVKEEKSPTLVFKNPFKFISRLIYYFTGVGIPFPSPGDLPNPGIKPRSPALQADSLPTEL